MHTDSGLIEEIPQGITISQAEQQVLDYIKQWVTEERTAPLAGNSIGTDRMFLNRQMPLLDKYLHYRNIDVSSLKELTILESIQELRYYRKAILVEEPGPDSETAKGIANSLSADRI
jgi:oligoribonuclease